MDETRPIDRIEAQLVAEYTAARSDADVAGALVVNPDADTEAGFAEGFAHGLKRALEILRQTKP
jgi:hypothetical protein